MVRRKTHEEFVREVFDLVGDEYELVSPYIKRRIKVTFVHKECGTKYEVFPDSFKTGCRCPKCAVKKVAFKRTKTHEQFVVDFKNTFNDNFVLLSRYEHNKTKINVLHKTCGNTMRITPNHLLNKKHCTFCTMSEMNANKAKTSDIFAKEIYKLVGDEYEFLKGYKKGKEKLPVKHNVCGEIYEVVPNSFLMGSRCPKCNISKGEFEIKKTLMQHNINFKEQFKIEKCRNILPLPFDFGLIENSKLVALIEYDGKQHFEPVKQWGGEIHLKKVQQRDQIKNNYCLQNNIPLLRIPYTDFDGIENHIIEFLKEYNLFQKPKQLTLVI